MNALFPRLRTSVHRRSLLCVVALCFAVFGFPLCAAERGLTDYAGQTNAPEGTKRIVFIAATGTHGGAGQHEFLAGANYLARTLNAAYANVHAVVYSSDAWPKPEQLAKADSIVVLLNHGGRAADDAGIKAACDRGAGFAAIHYGVEVNVGSQAKNYLDWMGGYFETFWSVNPTWEPEVQPGQHLVANGVKPFKLRDEWYYHMRFAPEMKGVTPVLSAVAPVNTVHFKDGEKPSAHGGNPDALADVKAGKPQHLAWAYERPNGKGRGFGFTGYHFITNLTNDSFRTTLLNGVAWASGLEIPKDGVPSKTPTDGDLKALMDEAHGNSGQPAAAAGKAQPQARKPIFETTVLTPLSKPRRVAIDAPLKDARELWLVVSDMGSKACDWACWIDPKLVLADGKTIDLTTLKWKSAQNSYGTARVNAAHNGKPMLVAGQTIAHGIGTHAPSTIGYDLPANAVRFTAEVAIDDGGMERDGKPSSADIKFLVFDAAPAPVVASPELSFSGGPSEVPVELFTVPEGLEVTMWAKSPLLFNPTNMDFDAEGRLYVAEGVNYRGKQGRRPEGDRIVVLEDTDGDGKADKSSVFYQGKDLEAPLGVAVLDDKVVVSQPPDLLVFTDKNRDRVFGEGDAREALLTGFGGRQHDHSLHSLIAGADGLWYFNQGNTGAQFTDRSGKTFRMGSPYKMSEIAGQRSDDDHVWIGGFSVRMNPDGTNVAIIGHNYRNSYEQTLTSLGDLFQSDNDDPPACRVSHVLEFGNAGFASADGQRAWNADKRPGQDTPTAEWRQEDPGTMPAGDVYGGGSPTGVVFYENGALGDRWRGLLLACEAGKNVVFGYFPKPDGAGFKLERFDFITSNKEKEFAGSDFLGGKPTGELKTKFRPSDVCVGPDGAIYVADWFDPGVGGHGTRDDKFTGAIYRIAPKGFKSVVPKLDLSTTAGQIAALKSPAINVRNAGFTRLKSAQSVSAVVEVLHDQNPYIAARAAWLLAQMGEPGIAAVKPWLRSKDASQRLVAFRALRRAGHEVIPMARAMATDPDAAVRREVALAMRDVPIEQSRDILVTVARGFDGKDRSYLEAIGLGAEGKEAAVHQAIAAVMGSPADAWSEAFAWLTWRLHPAQTVADLKARAMSDKLDVSQRKLMLTALGFTETAEAARAMIELAQRKGYDLADLARWWLMNRKGNLWKAYGVDESLKALGIYDPDKVKLVASPMPSAVKDARKLDAAAIAKLNGDPARAQNAAQVCFICHRIGDQGIDFGPDLSVFAKGQTKEVLIEHIITPSATISHGFEGSEIQTTDGLTITGMILSDGDPVLIKSMGNMVQTVPKSRVAKIQPLGRSLMYDPAMLGLEEQTVADIVAWLKAR